MIPLGSTELLGTGKQSLVLLPILLLFLPGCDSFGIHTAAGDRKKSLALLSILLLFLPGCDALGINRAAGYREAEFGAVAIVVVARVICCDLLVFFGEYLDTCWDKNGKSVSSCF